MLQSHTEAKRSGFGRTGLATFHLRKILQLSFLFRNLLTACLINLVKSLALMFRELLSRDREDESATGQPQGFGPPRRT
ncbi:MAG: hypothetical protein P8075_16595 [Deltaproteobacteria bacterium]|jgi:hypothetical protein